MLSIRRFQSDIKPDVFIQESVNSYTYNYNIIEKEVEFTEPQHEDEDPVVSTKTVFEFTPFRLSGMPNKSQCTQAVIREVISQDDEFKLLNDIKSVDLGIIEGNDAEKIVSKYRNYLKFRQAIRTNVSADFESI